VYVDRVRADRDAAVAEVERANREFYDAFEGCDLDRMERIWARGAHVRCVHPGWELLEGWAAVRRSWQRILAGAPEMELQIDSTQVRVGGDVGWVVCIERLVRRAGQDLILDSVLATNVFERDADGRWLIVQHHASPILARGGSRTAPARRGDVN
jgi:ketosteroid isomerase-like protein